MVISMYVLTGCLSAIPSIHIVLRRDMQPHSDDRCSLFDVSYFPSIHAWSRNVTRFLQVLASNTTVRTACITGDLDAAEELLTKEIDADADDFFSYANRSFVRARKREWNHALQDAIKVRHSAYCRSLGDICFGDLVHRYPTLVNGIRFQGYRPLRQGSNSGCNGVI